LFYRFIFRAFFQKLDPEFAHELVVAGLKAARILGLLRAPKPKHSYRVMGLNFENLLGMAAGFDKNGQLIRELHALGLAMLKSEPLLQEPSLETQNPDCFACQKIEH